MWYDGISENYDFWVFQDHRDLQSQHVHWENDKLDQPKLTPETLTVHSDERKNDREINQCWSFKYWPSNFFGGECLQKFAETSVEDFLNWKFCKRKSTSLDHTLGDSPLRIATMVPDLS